MAARQKRKGNSEMVTIYKHKRGGWYLELRPVTGQRRYIYLRKVSRVHAEKIKTNIERILQADRFNLHDPEMVAWVQGLDEKLRDKLRAAGVPIGGPVKTWKVCEWIQHVTDTYPGKPRTKKGVETARKHWDGYLGHMLLKDVTTGHVREAIESIRMTAKPSHASRLCERGKMFFQRAVEFELIKANPFTGLDFGGKTPDQSRRSLVSAEVVYAVIEAAPNQHARTLIALARFAGLRVPTDAINLRWSDIDWQQERLRIPDDSKTGRRVLPLFAPAIKELQSLSELADDGDEFIFTRARASAATTWRNWLISAITHSHQTPWPKLWHNLRASLRSELKGKFAPSTLDAWFGHSTRVAEKHYEMVTPEEWEQAARTGRQYGAQYGAQGRNVSRRVPGGPHQEKPQ